jgi:hypothetical protein
MVRLLQMNLIRQMRREMVQKTSKKLISKLKLRNKKNQGRLRRKKTKQQTIVL